MAKRGTTIRIFLVDGVPQGVRVVDRTGWTGACLAFSRADYVRARQRDEVTTAGVYVLTGPDPERSDVERVYVGEADEVRARLDQHQREKDFWTAAYVFVSKDRSLNKAHVRYLEARLVTLAREAGRAVLENSTAPQYRGLSEAETADMDAYLDDRFQGFGRRVALTRALKGAQDRRAYPTSNRRFSWTPTWTPLPPHSMPALMIC